MIENPTEVEALYKQGMSQREIAQRFGVHQATISRLMASAQIAARRAGTVGHRLGLDALNWKGDSAGYAVLHNRVIAARGRPAHCEGCGRTGGKATGRDTEYQWANVSGNYAEPGDYLRLCRSCHMRFDDVGRRSNLGRAPRPRGADGRFLPGDGCTPVG